MGKCNDEEMQYFMLMSYEIHAEPIVYLHPSV